MNSFKLEQPHTPSNYLTNPFKDKEIYCEPFEDESIKVSGDDELREMRSPKQIKTKTTQKMTDNRIGKIFLILFQIIHWRNSTK